MFIVPITRRPSPLARGFDRLFDDAFERFAAPLAADADSTSRSPALDVAEAGGTYTIKLDMPGVAKEDIQISVEGRRVNVQASVRSETESDAVRVLYRERSASTFARIFTLPAEVDQAQALAKLELGVLTLTLPKRSAAAASQITIN